MLTSGSCPYNFFFLTTGMGTTWKILALCSSVSRVTQVGRKLPLKPTNAIFSVKGESEQVKTLPATP